VLSSFGLLATEDVALDAPDLDLDGAKEWAADVCARLPGGGVPPVAAEVLAVRDLELVDPARWPQALELLATPSLRAALVEPARVLLADGRHADVPSYTAWWLRRHPVLGGHRPTDVRAAGTDPPCQRTRRSPARWEYAPRLLSCSPNRAGRTSCWSGWPTPGGR
jgi:hypothetical protein